MVIEVFQKIVHLQLGLPCRNALSGYVYRGEICCCGVSICPKFTSNEVYYVFVGLLHSDFFVTKLGF